MAWFNRFFFGTNADNIIEANDRSNLIYGFGGDDTIIAGGGNDTVFGGSGDDWVDGGTGNDYIFGGWGNDTLFGGLGRDYISGGFGADYIDGGDGRDRLFGGFDNDTIFGGAGSDDIFGGSGEDYIDGGTGNDDLYGGFGNDTILGGEGADYISGGGGDDIIDGGSESDYLRGNWGDDTISGDDGADDIFGGRGDDTLDGGQGSDYLYGQSGNDTLILTSSAETGGLNFYNGGTGVDTLVLNLTAAEFASQATADDLAGFLAFVSANLGGNGQANSSTFDFATLNLRVTRIENLQVFVDGVQVDPADAGPQDPGGNDPVATDDSFDATDGAVLSGDVTANDSFDAGTVVTLISGVSAGLLILNADGSFTFDPQDDFAALAEGQTQTVSFEYSLSGGGDTNTAVATITVTGTNDVPTVSGALSASVTEGAAVQSFDLLDGASDVDAGTELSVANVTGLVPGVTLDGSNVVVDPSNAAFDSLGLGDSQDIVISFDVIDGAGGTVPQTLTVTVTGTNDAPTISGALSAAATSGAATISVDLLSGAADVDAGTVLSIDGLTDLPAGVTLDGTTLSFDPSDPAYADISDGTVQTIVLTYTITDGDGGSVEQTLTLTVTGSNSNPTVTAALTASATEGAAPLVVDLLDGASDPDIDTTLTITDLPSELPAGVTVDGSQLTFDGTDAAYDALADGETTTLLLSYTISDGAGGSVEQTLTITVTGTNDAPVVAAALTGSAAEGEAAVSFDLLDGASDVDNGAELSVANVVGLVDGVSFDGTTLSLDPSNAAFDSLGVGDNQEIVISFDVVDGAGGTTPQTLTLTVTGTNDVPTVASALTRNVVEGSGEGAPIFLLSGASDIDASDSLFVTNLTGLVDGVSYNNDIDAVFVDASDPAFEALADGESQEIVISYDVSDGNGGSVPQTLTITVTGTNDAPVVAAALTAAATEGGAAVSVDLLDGASDVDNGAELSVANVVGLMAALTLDGSTLNIDASDPAFDALAAGETQDITVTFDVVDGEGGSVAQTLTITVTGTNDAPVVAAALTAAATEGGAAVSVDLLDGASDVDNGAELSVANVVGLVAGLTLDGSTLNIDASDPAFDALAAGETQNITVTFDVIDGEGGSVPQTLTLTVTGTNDAPVVAAALTAVASEDSGITTVDLLDGASDVDAGDVLSVDSASVTGLTAGVTLDGSVLSLDPSDAAFQSLAVNESTDIVVTFDIIDQAGARVTQTVTLTVTGTNDVPTVASALTRNVVEGSGEGSPIFLLSGASDIDASDSLFVTNLTGLVDGVSYNNDIDAIFVDASDPAFEALADGESQEIVISYDVSDGNGGSVPQTLTITVAGSNDAPVVSAALGGTISEDETDIVTFDLLAGASDSDNGAVLSVLFGDMPLPPGFSVDGSTLSVDLTQNPDLQALAAGQTQDITINFDVVDEFGASTPQSLTVTVEGQNDGPSRIGFIPNVAFALNQPFSFDADETNFVDIDNGDSLTFTATLNNGDPLPDFITFDPATLTFSGTATGAEAGIYSIRVTATDQSGAMVADVFNLSLGGNFIIGTVNSETLNGTNADEILIGLAGDDALAGGRGNDTYVFNAGDGVDTVSDNGNTADTNDRVQFVDYDFADATFTRDLNSTAYTISFANGDSVTINNTLNDGSRVVEFIDFADQTLTLDDVRALLLTQSITDGDDSIYGYSTEDELEGGLGDDFLDGGTGNDVYIFNAGDGSDTILDMGSVSDTQDTLRFTDYAFADATFTRDAGTQIYTITFANGDSVLVNATLEGGSRTIDLLEFTDRTVTLDELRLILIENQTTDGDDEIFGYFVEDTLEGGLGDDVLSGGRGADTYIFNSGDGSDTISDNGLFSNVIDTVRFTDYAFADATFTREGRSADYTITFANGDSVLITDTLNGGGRATELLEFTDRTVTLDEVREILLDVYSTDGDDMVFGYDTADTLEGGLGDDVLEGGRGADTYIFNSGDGSDTVSDNGLFSNVVDTIQFTDYAFADATFTRDGRSDAYTITFANGDSVLVTDTLNGGGRAVEVLEFTDRTVELSEFREILLDINSTDGNDTIFGYVTADVLEGGLGDDSLEGGRGADTYIFNAGDGVDSIDDNGLFNNVIDTLVFTDYTSSEATFSREGASASYTITFANGDTVNVADTLNGGSDTIDIVQFTDVSLTIDDVRLRILEDSSTDGNDSVFGYNTADTLEGGLGDDTLNGGSSSDRYIFNAGDGSDTIDDNSTSSSSNADVVEFTNYALSDAIFSSVGDTLIISFANGDSVTMLNTLSNSTQGIESFEFTDQTLTIEEMRSVYITAQQTTGDDTISGTAFADTFEAGEGNDTLSGGRGDDRYVFNIGDGVDSIEDNGFSSDDNTLEFTGYNVADASITRSGNDLVLSFGNGDQVVITNGYVSSSDRIDSYVFLDDTLTFSEVIAIAELGNGTPGDDVITGTEAGETLSGQAGNDVISGLGGDDEINGGSGDDTLTGGTGSDIITTGSGSDTIIFASGDGQDTVFSFAGEGDTDTLQFTDYDIADANFSESGNDLIIRFLSEDEVVVENILNFSQDGDFNVVFADGTLSLDAIADLLIAEQQTDGNDSIFGFNRDNIFEGGLGDDDIFGAPGDDTYIYSSGDGTDFIFEAFGNDTVQFTDYDIADATVTVDGRDLVIRFSDDDAVIIANGAGGPIPIGPGGPRPIDGGDGEGDGDFFNDPTIEFYEFADGTLTFPELMELVEVPEPMTLVGDDGDNTLIGGAGDDLITGGLGNDTLIGGAGNDTFFFGIGDGQDIIERDAFEFGFDTLVISGYSVEEMIVNRNFELGTATISFIDSNDSITIDYDDFRPGLDTIIFENDPADDTDDVFVDVFELFGGPIIAV